MGQTRYNRNTRNLVYPKLSLQTHIQSLPRLWTNTHGHNVHMSPMDTTSNAYQDLDNLLSRWKRDNEHLTWMLECKVQHNSYYANDEDSIKHSFEGFSHRKIQTQKSNFSTWKSWKALRKVEGIGRLKSGISMLAVQRWQQSLLFLGIP